ncbi:MAG: hypothetical protein V4669_13770 [Pseudomonadota bacterium]
MFEGNDQDSNEKPGIEEIYELATNTSNLRQEADRRGSADVLRDMAMSASRIGAALLRLRGQWESSEKPVRQRTRSVKEFADILPPKEEGIKYVKGKPQIVRVPDTAAAIKANDEERARHEAWYRLEMERLVGGLAALPEVREQLTFQALKWGMGQHPDPAMRRSLAESIEKDGRLVRITGEALVAAIGEAEKLAAQINLNAVIMEVEARRKAERDEEQDRAQSKATAVIRYWLDQTCQTCDGRKWQSIPNSPSLSTKACRACGGSGVAQVPHQQDGRRLANHMDQCAHRYSQAMRDRRQSTLAHIPPIERLSKRMQEKYNPLRSDDDSD